MSDVDLSGFEGLKDPEDTTYPGSTTVRRSMRPEGPVGPIEPPKWDARPIRRTFTVKGHKVTQEFFHIGALSQALGKSQITLRAWMDKGWLPEARYRDKPQVNATGKVVAGRRLWTREQIEAIVTIATEEGMLLGRGYAAKMNQKNFTKRVLAFFRKELEA